MSKVIYVDGKPLDLAKVRLCHEAFKSLPNKSKKAFFAKLTGGKVKGGVVGAKIPGSNKRYVAKNSQDARRMARKLDNKAIKLDKQASGILANMNSQADFQKYTSLLAQAKRYRRARNDVLQQFGGSYFAGNF